MPPVQSRPEARGPSRLVEPHALSQLSVFLIVYALGIGLLCSPLVPAQTASAEERSVALEASATRKSEPLVLSRDADLVMRMARDPQAPSVPLAQREEQETATASPLHDALLQDVAQLRRANTELLQTLTHLRQAQEDAQAQMIMLASANASLKTSIQDLAWNAQTANQTKERLAEERAILDDLQARQQAERYQALRAEHLRLQQTHDGLERTLAGLREENGRLQADIDQAHRQDRAASLRAELHRLTEINRRLEATVQDVQKKLQNAEQLTEYLKKNQEAVAQKYQHLKEETDVLKTDLTQERARMSRELGAAYTKAQLFEHAIEAYTRSLEYDPDNAQAHYYLGLLDQHARNNEESAVSHLERYLDLSPDLPSTTRQEVEYLIRMLKKTDR